MPEVVDTFLEEENFYVSREVLKEFYDNYLADMQLYQASPESIIRSKAIFNNIYGELNKENKNFKASLIEEGAKNRDMKTPVDWLVTAKVVNKSYLVNEIVTTPLIQDENTNFRLYLADIGMFSYQSGINTAAFFTKDSKNVLSGIFFENYVANELASKDIKLCYWKGKNYSELEFLVESLGVVYPIDVKKGRGTLNSLEKYRNHNSNKIAIKISKNNYGYDANSKLLTIPLYEVFLLASDLSNGEFEI
jgi:predicted AAA+ superfamily ATPase